MEPCLLKLDIEIPADESRQVFERTVQTFNRSVKVPGFRPGKTPRSLLVGRYGDEINKETTRELIQTGMRRVLEQEAITPETNPRIENEDAVVYREGEPFVFAITFDVAPEFELPEYKGIRVSRDGTAVADSSVDEVISGWLQQRASYERVERPSAAGDLLKVSYCGTLEDETVTPPETASFLLNAQETWLALREPELIPGVSSELTGLSAGAEKNVTVSFPADFGIEALAGQKAAYHFTIHEVHAAQVPELDDSMAKQIGAESADQVRERVRQNLEAEKTRREDQAVRDQIIRCLVGNLEFPLPPNMLRRESYQILNRLYENEARSGASADSLKERLKELMDQANKRAQIQLRQHYILEKIADAEDLKVEANELEGAIRTLSNVHRVSVKVMARRLRESDRLADLLQSIREAKTLDRLVSLADIVETDAKREQE